MMQHLRQIINSNPKIDQLYQYARNWFFPTALNRTFWEFYNFLNEAQFYSRERLRQLQFQKLIFILHYAYNNSLFYKNLYDQHGVNINSIQSFEDFKKQIPLVSKEMLKNSRDVTVYSKKMNIGTTSGTTGSPFQFYTDRTGDSINMAAIYHQWAQAGFKPGDLRIEIRGIQSAPIMKIPAEHVVRFSTVNMKDNMRKMVEFLNTSRIQFIHGYPSAITKFSVLLRDQNLSLGRQVKGVFLASETVYDWQVDIINDCIKPEHLIAHYGCAERVALGSWCNKKRAYHFNPLYGYLEQGDLGNVVGTSFTNSATPFIRYQMSDLLVDWSETPCPECNRGYTPLVQKIGGRLEDYLVDEKDELIPPAVVTFPFKNLHAIKSVQIVQKEDKNLVLKCVADTSNPLQLQREKDTLSQAFKKLLGNTISTHFEEQNEIELTDNLKFRWIISKAKKPLLERL